MIIEVSDDLTGAERKEQIFIKQVHYAMQKFDSRHKVAAFLGISTRGFRALVSKYPELYRYKGVNKMELKSPDQMVKYLERLAKF